MHPLTDSEPTALRLSAHTPFAAPCLFVAAYHCVPTRDIGPQDDAATKARRRAATATLIVTALFAALAAAACLASAHHVGAAFPHKDSPSCELPPIGSDGIGSDGIGSDGIGSDGRGAGGGRGGRILGRLIYRWLVQWRPGPASDAATSLPVHLPLGSCNALEKLSCCALALHASSATCGWVCEHAYTGRPPSYLPVKPQPRGQPQPRPQPQP